MLLLPQSHQLNLNSFKHIKSVTAALYPESRVAPAVSTGFTDSHFTRELGIDSYGFNPIIFDPNDFAGVHGNNERVKVSSYLQGTEDLSSNRTKFRP